jgi:hypothetical protein
MKRPPIDIRNYEELYAYYDQQPISPIWARVGHGASRAVYAMGRMVMADKVAEQIQDITRPASGKRLIGVVNHTTMGDSFVVAAEMARSSAFADMIGNTSIVGKHTIAQKSPAPVKAALDNIGYIPAFLSHRTGHLFSSPETHKEFQRGAAEALGKVCVNRMLFGGHLVMHPEIGGRNRENPRQVNPFHIGLGHIASGVAQDFETYTVPVGVVYPSTGRSRHLRSLLVVGLPEKVDEHATPDEIVKDLPAGVQAAVDRGHNLLG